LERLGPVELEVIHGGPELRTVLQEGFQIEAAAWKGREGTAMGSRPELHSFYTRLATRTAEQGWLRLHFLRVGGRRIAFAYSLCFNRTIFLLKPGYLPEYAAYSPSKILLYMVLREAFPAGIVAYDFLGADDVWKRDWTAEARPHFWLFVFRRGPKLRTLYFTKFRVVPWIKNMFRACRAVAARMRRRVLPH
jgi:CelD/BcsL family acetyltransferase involved in cellulose biosynthesis